MDRQEPRMETNSANASAEGPSAQRSVDVHAASVSLEEFQEVKSKVDDILISLKRLSATTVEEMPEVVAAGSQSMPVSAATERSAHSVRFETGIGEGPESSLLAGKKKSGVKLAQLSYGTDDYDGTRSRATVFGQAKISRELPLAVRGLGVCLSFVTVVFVWETVDAIAKLVCPHSEERLVCYLIIALLAAALLVLIFTRINDAVENGEQTLLLSFGYALSTLFLAIGSWGVIYTSVTILVPQKQHTFVWLVGGIFALIASFSYTYLTRHNALLDIASCATSLGLSEDAKADLGLFSLAPTDLGTFSRAPTDI